MAGYLTKPISAEVLSQCIHEQTGIELARATG
jgi:hypothetical protein